MSEAMQCKDDLLQSLQCRDVRLQFILCRDVLFQSMQCKDVRLQPMQCYDVLQVHAGLDAYPGVQEMYVAKQSSPQDGW